MKHLTDQELMRIVQAGDYSPGAEIYDRYSTRIYNFAWRFLRNEALAADATQEVFLRMLKHANSFRENSSLPTWLFAITANWCRDYCRRIDNRTPNEPDDILQNMPADELDGPERRAERTESARIVADALASLKAEQREAIILARYQDMSHSEIAKIAGCSVGAVKARIFRGMELMREYLTRKPQEEAPADVAEEVTPAEPSPVEETNV